MKKFKHVLNCTLAHLNFKYLIMCKLIFLLVITLSIQTFGLGFGPTEISLSLIDVSLKEPFKAIDAPFAVPVRGKVVDEEGLPLAGVSIQEKGKSNGTTSKEDGSFSLTVSDVNAVLAFSFVGYLSQEIKVGNQVLMLVTLQPISNKLNEVIVIGYGTVKKKDLTGAVASVKMADIERAPVKSFEEALGGRVAGVTATSDDGQPGASVNIVIRGNNSLTQDNSPLYVIDGFPLENPNNNAINPAEIASIEILKDASSTAIYGARGANGVVLITTKKGKEGKSVINYNSYYGFQQNNRKMPLMNAYEYVKFQSERDPVNTDSTYLNNGRTLEDYRNVKGIDLQDSLFSTSPFRSQFLSLSGGNKDTKYSISGSILNQDGILTNSGYDRYQGRVRLDQRVNDHLNVGINTNYSHMQQYGTSPALGGNGFYYGNLLYSVWAFRPIKSGIAAPTDVDSEDEEFLVLNGFNPIKTARNEMRRNISDVLSTNAYIDYTFAKYFTARVTGGFTSNKTRREEFNNSQTPRGSPLTKTGQDNGVSGSVIHSSINNWVNENTLSFNKKFGKFHQVNAVTGFTMSGSSGASYGASANHIPNEELGISGIDEGIPITINSTSSNFTLASFLGRVNYSFRSKYIFTASFRADGSSKFAPQNRWSYFPSGAIAWRLSDEDFMKGLRTISNAKIRLSYGSTGNNRVSDFAYLSRISLPSSAGYSYNNQPVNAAILSELGNVNLKWETTEQADIGLELGFFKQRITLEADVYRKVTSNLLLNAAVPGSIGFNTAFKNIGKVQNQGIELTLNTVNIKSKSFTWNSGFNISFNRNKVLALSDNETTRLTTAPWNTYTSNVPLYVAEIGYPLARFQGYLWEGNYQYADFDENTPGVYTIKAEVPHYGVRNNIRPGDIKFKDINGDGVVNADDRTIIGNPNPNYTGGLVNNFTYKDFDLNIFFQFSVGNEVININRVIFEGGGNINQNMFATYIDRWTPENQNNKYFRAGGQGPNDFSYSSRVIEDGSYLKLKTASLGYNIPLKHIKRVKMTNARLYVSVQNLLTWTNYQGFDPEVSKFGSSALRPAFDYSVYPNARTITFGLNVQF